MDKLDKMLSVSAGSLCAAMDFLWSDDISLDDAQNWGKEKTENIITLIASKTGYKDDSFAGAVCFLNGAANSRSTNCNPVNTRIREYHDFSDNLGFRGLLFSIFEACTDCAYGTDENGEFQIKNLAEIRSIKKESLLEAVYFGAVGWLLRVASSKKGYSLSQEEGISGFSEPIREFLADLCSLEGIGPDLEQTFYDAGIDFNFHMELGITAEMIKKKRYIPVLVYEAIISGFYSIRKLIEQVKNKHQTVPDLHALLPRNNPELNAMRKLTAISFTTVDFSANGLKAAIKNKGNKEAFVKDLLQGINYCGLGRLLALAKEDILDKLECLSGFFIQMEEHMVSPADYPNVNSIPPVNGMPMTYLEAVQYVYNEVITSFAECIEAHEERLRIEAECRETIFLLKQNRTQMEQVVEQYMSNHLILFTETVDNMENAHKAGDTNTFLQSNAVLQESLGMNVQFTTQAEFENFMDSDLDFDL